MNLLSKTSLRNLGLSVLSAAVLSACGGGGSCVGCSNGGASGYNLVVDSTSPVPVINGNTQQFYVYVTNTGKGNATNLNWNLSNTVTPKTSLFSKIKSLAGFSDKQLKDSTADPISIVDASDCTNVNGGQNCRILMNATSAAALVLEAKSSTSSGSTSAIVQSTVSSYTYKTPSGIDPVGTGVLTLSSLTAINYGDGFAGSSFFIMNNGSSSVSLDNAPLGTLPAGIKLADKVNNCPNPLPSGQACQVRLTADNSVTGSSGAGTTTPVNLVPEGKVNGVELPAQQSQNLIVSNEKVGYPSLSKPVIIATQTGDSSATGVISNTGSASMTIDTLTSSSSILVIEDDNCSGKTLPAGASCTYKTIVDYSSLHGDGSGVVTVPYNDGKKNGTTETDTSWTYVPTFVSNPGVTITSSGNLTQDNRTQTITIKNTGNVPLNNITAPDITPSNSQVALNGDCPSPLALGDSCIYTLTYTPVAPSQNTSVSIKGVSASYEDEYHNTKILLSDSSTSVDLSSTFTGFIKTGGDISLDGTTKSKTITLENKGTYDATLSNIGVSGTNLQLGSGTCANGTTLKVGGTCTLTVALTDGVTAGSGNGNLNVTYDNHDGNPETKATSNIDWTIGSVPSLKVSFAQSNLFVAVGGTQDVEVTLENDGNDPFTNITLPTLPAGFSWVAPTTNACSLNGTQSLALNTSCKLTLRYAPTSAVSGQTVTIGKFSATTASGSYNSASDYSVTETAATNNALGGIPSNGITQSPTWVTPNQSNEIVIRNNSGREITFTGTSVSDGLPVTASGCSGKLAAGVSCTLKVAGTYTANASGSVAVNYTDNGVAFSQSVNVTATYAQKPTINPGLTVTRDPSGELAVLNNGTGQPITLTLTNTTTVTNQQSSSDGTLKVLASSLLPTGGDLSYEVQTDGNNCPIDANGYIILSNAEAPANSCTYKVVAKSTGTAGTSGSSTASPSYKSQTYSDTSTTPSEQNNTSSSDYGVSYTILAPTASLSTPTLVDSTTSGNLQNVEQGTTPSPTIKFKLKNVGATSVAGSITATPTVAGLTIDTSACANLAPNAECEISVTMDPSSPVSGNLKDITLNFGNGATAGTPVALPDLPYSVIVTAAPAISMSMSVANCQNGTAKDATLTNLTTLPTCNINTGASNLAPVVTLTFTNTGAGAAKNFIVTPTDLKAALGSNYDQTLTGTCATSGTTGTTLAATNGSCTVIISPTSANTNVGTNSATTQYDIAGTDGISLVNVPYSYKYGTNSISSPSNLSASVGLDSNVVPATLSITSTDNPLNIKLGATSKDLTVTASDWYTTPANPKFSFSPANAGLTASACDFAGGNSTCTTKLTVGSTVAINSYSIKATSGSVSSSALAFTVIGPWVPVGSAGFSAGTAASTSLAIAADGTPYVAYQDRGNSFKATVMKFNGISWETVGSAGFSAGTASFTSLALAADGTPYVAYRDGANRSKATVMKFNGSSWVTVGSAGFSAGSASTTSLALAADGTPYVAYEDYANSNKATVMKFNGSSWVNVGNAGFSAGSVVSISLVIAVDGTPYVAYGGDSGATVKKFDGSLWVNVGNPDFSARQAYYTSLALAADGTPYVAYQDVGNSSKATVMKFNGSLWETVGNAGFSADVVYDTSLALVADGTPYVAYEDSANSLKATVMKYAP